MSSIIDHDNIVKRLPSSAKLSRDVVLMGLSFSWLMIGGGGGSGSPSSSSSAQNIRR
jgi:hypothetical protein